jgi:hypothetical protein
MCSSWEAVGKMTKTVLLMLQEHCLGMASEHDLPPLHCGCSTMALSTT